MALKYSDIQKKLQQGKYDPIYLLYGEEPWFIDQLYAEIEKSALAGAEPSFNHEVFYGPEIDARVLMGALRSYPMMAERRVVVIREAHRIRKDQFERLAAYFEKPPPTTVSIWLHRASNLPDRRSKAGKALAANACIFESKKLFDNKAREWAHEYAVSKGLQPNPKASFLLVEALGASVQSLANEIDNLALRLEDSSDKRVDEAIIYDAIQLDRDYNVFELLQAIGARDAARAHRIVRQMSLYLKQHPPVMVLGQLQGWLLKMLVVLHKRVSQESAVAQLLGIPPFVARQYVDALKHWNLRGILQALESVRRADQDLKGLRGSRMEDAHIVQVMVFEVLAA